MIATPARVVAFLGAGKNDETEYALQGIGVYRTRYAPVALAKLLGAREAWILATNKARKANGEGIQQEMQAIGAACELVDIPDGASEAELWEIFQTLRATLEAGEGEVVFDITHGFRSLPFFAAAAVSYMRALGKAERLSVFYAAYTGTDRTPIWDLSPFLSLLDWAQALHVFMRTGHAEEVRRLGEVQERELRREIARKGGRRFPRVGVLVKAISAFADDLATVRIPHLLLGYEQAAAQGRGAHPPSSAQRLLDAIEETKDEAEKVLPALAPLLDDLRAWAEALPAQTLAGEAGRRSLAALAKLYLQLERYPEAAIVVREGALCVLGTPEVTDVGRAYRHAARERFDKEHRGLLRDKGIAALRNDLEHGGFQQQPKSASHLKGETERLVKNFAEGKLPRRETQAAQEVRQARTGRTWLITRHAGARQWVEQKGIRVDAVLGHLDEEALGRIQQGDTIIGTLPIHLVAEVCARGARYLHLSLNLPPEARGKELAPEEMERYGARLEGYHVQPNK